MKKKRRPPDHLLEVIVFTQILDFIFDRKSRITLTDIELKQINLFTKISTILDAASLQHLLARIESHHRIKIENEEIFQLATINGLPGAIASVEVASENPYRIKTFMALTRLILCKI